MNNKIIRIYSATQTLPCSNMFEFCKRSALCIKACLTLPGLIISGPRCFKALNKSATAPATTGEATDVPERVLQPDTRLDPRTLVP